MSDQRLGCGARLALLLLLPLWAAAGAVWWFAPLGGPKLLHWAAAGFLLLLGATAPLRREPRAAIGMAMLLSALGFAGFAALQPSHERAWRPEQSRMPQATIVGDELRLLYARAFRWAKGDGADAFEPAWFDAAYDLRRLEGLDFLISPFGDVPGIAHTMFSFRFDDGRRIVVSPEVRKERGEAYDPKLGLFRNYELMYVLADERDALHLRTNVWGDEVYAHPVDVQPATARRLLEHIAARVQQLHEEPAFYNTILASCSTSLGDHVEAISEPPIHLDWRVLLPGFSDELGFELGLLGGPTIEALRERNATSPHAGAAADRPDFARAIRGLPPILEVEAPDGPEAPTEPPPDATEAPAP